MAATAVAASYMNIPLLHTQGGEQTGSIDDKVRHCITKLANVHFTATSESKKNVIRMGEDPSLVFHTGCPALDLVRDTDLGFESITEPLKGSGCVIDFQKPYSLIVYHPVTDEIEESSSFLPSLISHVKLSAHPHIWLWPNVDAGSDLISKILRTERNNDATFSSKVRFVRSYSPSDYLRVLNNSVNVIGNSSSFIRECSLLGIPSLLLGNRQRSRELSSNVRCLPLDKLSTVSVNDAVNELPLKSDLIPSDLYSYCDAGSMIASIISNLEITSRKSSLFCS